MPEYIERNAILQKAKELQGELFGASLIVEAIKNAPTADVAEVKYGEWILKSTIHQMFDDVDEEFYVECSLCERAYYVPFELEERKMLEYAKKEYPYCHCGAKMDKE